MSFFKDFKGDANDSALGNKKEEKTKDDALKSTDSEHEKKSIADDDFLDEDMYKDILAAAEEMLSDEDTENDSNAKTDNKDNNQDTNKDEKAGETMVDYDENAVDAELLDTLLGDEESHTEEKTAETKAEDVKESAKAEEKAEEKEAVKPDEKKEEVKPVEKPTEEDRESVTVITKGTTINGSIISDCSLDVMGTINGDVECLGKLSITGKVTGNSMASEVFVDTDRMEGCINSEGCVKIGLGTVIIGDITANSAVIAGAVKGEIDVNGPVVLDSTAIIKGNIKAKSVQMNNGAVLEGFCSLAYAAVDIDNIFE